MFSPHSRRPFSDLPPGRWPGTGPTACSLTTKMRTTATLALPAMARTATAMESPRSLLPPHHQLLQALPPWTRTAMKTQTSPLPASVRLSKKLPRNPTPASEPGTPKCALGSASSPCAMQIPTSAFGGR